MDANAITVHISGESQGLVAALNDGSVALSSFSQKTDVVLKQVSGSTDKLLKKIEQNTGGTLLFLQRVTVAMHGIGKVFSTIGGAFSSYIKDANDANFAMTDEARQKAIELEESVNSLCTVAKSVKDEFLSAITPYLSWIIEGISTFVGWIRNATIACPFLSKVLGVLATAIGVATAAIVAFNIAMQLNPFVAAATAILSVVTILTTAAIAWYGSTVATDVNTNALKKNAAAERKAAEEKERAAKAARKKEEAEKKAAEAAKKAQEAQKGIAESEKSLADSGKSSAQKEVEKIDEDITTFKSNWHTRKNWLRQQEKKRKLTKEEQTELDSMTPERYYDYINAQKQRQHEIRSGLSYHDYQPENLESDEVRAAKDNLANLRANGASSEAVAQAEKAVKSAEMRFTQVALRSSGWEKENARAAYEAARKDYENSGDKDDFQREALYKAMIDAQKRSQEADANFSRLAEQNYKMHEVKMPEYTYSSAGGTFNAYAVGALGSDIPKQQLETLQKVADKMDDIIDNQKEAGVFA
ncbi:MAG: hypothetical protein IJQ39_14130 [Thermoguttaceae bacterium]|nr:hypothetical protein [Thermoguttaceae bacterium]